MCATNGLRLHSLTSWQKPLARGLLSAWEGQESEMDVRKQALEKETHLFQPPAPQGLQQFGLPKAPPGPAKMTLSTCPPFRISYHWKWFSGWKEDAEPQQSCNWPVAQCSHSLKTGLLLLPAQFYFLENLLGKWKAPVTPRWALSERVGSQGQVHLLLIS